LRHGEWLSVAALSTSGTESPVQVSSLLTRALKACSTRLLFLSFGLRHD
jgi:hypothetical protein